MNYMNPRFDKFLEENKHITVLGVAWAFFWRMYIVLFGIGFFVGVLSAI